MKPTKVLPEGYKAAGDITLKKNKKLLLFLNLLGLPWFVIFPFVPSLVIPWLVVGLIMNATGAIGDLYIIVRLIVAPVGVVIEDRGDGLSWYVPNVVLVKTV